MVAATPLRSQPEIPAERLLRLCLEILDELPSTDSDVLRALAAEQKFLRRQKLDSDEARLAYTRTQAALELLQRRWGHWLPGKLGGVIAGGTSTAQKAAVAIHRKTRDAVIADAGVRSRSTTVYESDIRKDTWKQGVYVPPPRSR